MGQIETAAAFDYVAFLDEMRIVMAEQVISCRELATLSGVDPSTISRILRSDRLANVDTLVAVASALREYHVEDEPDEDEATPDPAIPSLRKISQ